MADRQDEPRLFFSPSELAKEFSRLGLTEKEASMMLAALEKNQHFIRLRMTIAANKYYWPAVRAFLDNIYGLNIAPPSAPDGDEHFNEQTRNTRNAGNRVG